MKRFADSTREERIIKVMSLRRSDFCLVLEDLSEDNNISAILRTAESFGVGTVCIIHSQKKPKLSKNTSSGASKWLDIKYYKNPEPSLSEEKLYSSGTGTLPSASAERKSGTKRCLNALKKQGFKIIGALVDPDAKVLWEQKYKGKVAILVGNEAKGMSEVAQKMVDQNIYLPMFGLTESLNVSVAAGIFLYEVIRQKETS